MINMLINEKKCSRCGSKKITLIEETKFSKGWDRFMCQECHQTMSFMKKRPEATFFRGQVSEDYEDAD